MGIECLRRLKTAAQTRIKNPGGYTRLSKANYRNRVGMVPTSRQEHDPRRPSEAPNRWDTTRRVKFLSGARGHSPCAQRLSRGRRCDNISHTDNVSKSEPADATPDASPAETHLAPAPHELGANLIFTEHDLAPYFALDSLVKDADGSASARFRFDGERYEATLSYQTSGFAPRDHEDFRLDTVREFRVRVEAQDGTGERKASFLVSPRWPGMETTDGEPVSTPDIEGVNVRTQGSNLPLDAYPDLLRQATAGLDVNAGYFDRIHAYSNIFAFERYVRIDRSKSGKVVGSNSPMQRLFEHVGGDAKFRELREDDRGIEGYHHRTVIDSAGAAKLIDGHSIGKKVKHYHPKHVRDDPDDPLFHPKLGVSLQRDANADGSVPWSNRADVVRELDELLLNLLSWAGLPVRADESVYVADGGRTPEEIAAEVGCSKRTIYRVVDRLSGILSRRNGAVAFTSDYLADAIQRALGDVADALDKDGDSSGDGSAFDAWRHRYGVEWEDPPDARLQLRIGRVPEDVKAILREGYQAWIEAGRNPRRFDTAKFRYQKDGYTQVQVGR